MRRVAFALVLGAVGCSLTHDADRFSSGDGTGASGGGAGSGGSGPSGGGTQPTGGASGTGGANTGGAGGTSATGATGGTTASGGSGGSTTDCGRTGKSCCGQACLDTNVCLDGKCQPCGTLGAKCCEFTLSLGCPGTSGKDVCCSLPPGSDQCGGQGAPGTGTCKSCCYQCNPGGKWDGVLAEPAKCMEQAAAQCGKPANNTKWWSQLCTTLN
ncbi:MAG: hypothetical protein IPI67_09130 [Myxococcales bacterium]|nr:hypothetical protein [Myxococcales bacterium]